MDPEKKESQGDAGALSAAATSQGLTSDKKIDTKHGDTSPRSTEKDDKEMRDAEPTKDDNFQVLLEDILSSDKPPLINKDDVFKEFVDYAIEKEIIAFDDLTNLCELNKSVNGDTIFESVSTETLTKAIEFLNKEGEECKDAMQHIIKNTTEMGALYNSILYTYALCKAKQQKEINVTTLKKEEITYLKAIYDIMFPSTPPNAGVSGGNKLRSKRQRQPRQTRRARGRATRTTEYRNRNHAISSDWRPKSRVQRKTKNKKR